MNKITLRCADSTHTKAITEIYNPIVRDTAISFEIEVPDQKEMAKRVEKIGDTNPFIVALINDEVAGYAYSADFRTRKAYRFTKETTVYIHEDYRKQGVATILYEKLFEILKTQGVVKVMAVITIPNDKSVLFHERLGFNLSGTITKSGYKFKKFWDVCFYEKTIKENLISVSELKNWKKVKNQFPELID